MPATDAVGLLIGLSADHVLGDPGHLHPVAGFGAAADVLEQRLWADSRPRGAVYAGLAVLPVVGLGMVGQRSTTGSVRVLAVASATFTVVGARSLRRAAAQIDDALLDGDLDRARELLPWLCGRDPSGLDADDLARAVVESLAENTSDAVVAPLLWGAMFGIPGLLGYRAVNTLDAMVGHRSPRYARFGWAAARVDDLANLVPARVTALLVVAVSRVLRLDARGAWRTWRRDGAAHPSPNAGQCEAAFAGALGVALGGPVVYGGAAQVRPVLGAGRAVTAADIAAARRLAAAVAWSALVVAASAALARGRWLR